MHWCRRVFVAHVIVTSLLYFLRIFDNMRELSVYWTILLYIIYIYLFSVCVCVCFGTLEMIVVTKQGQFWDYTDDDVRDAFETQILSLLRCST